MFEILEIFKDVKFYEYIESGYKETDDLEKVHTFYGEDMDILIEYIIDVCYKRKYFQFKEYLVDVDIKVNNNIYFNLQDFIEIKRREL